MSNVYKNTNIENYIIVKRAEPAGSNDEDKLVMFPTSMITGIEPFMDNDSGEFILRFAAAAADNDADSIQFPLKGSPSTIDEQFALINEVVGVLQRNAHTTKGSVIVLSDEVAGTVATESIQQVDADGNATSCSISVQAL